MLKPFACCCAVLAILGLPAAAGAAPERHTDVKVMTRNLFLGADLIPLAVSKPGAEFEKAAGDVLRQVTGSEPDARMRLVAREIAKAKPDLVGLQEVTLWRTGPKNDPAPATEVRVDYLATLRHALAAAGDVSVNRSFNQLDAKVRGAKFHFVNAHLEAYSADTRLDQAKELVKRALRTKRQTILV